MHIYVSIYIYICMYMYIYILICVCICICIYIYASQRWTPTLEFFLYTFPDWGPASRYIYLKKWLEISVFDEFFYLQIISFLAYHCSKLSNSFAPFDSSTCNPFYDYLLLYEGKDETYAKLLTKDLLYLLHSMNLVTKNSLLNQNL